ncbi:hypothetical protein GQ42DRAFT_90633 [Ramicandelaber brevisporus]|nr:hypothetical protein GQ42DRAFT_90633 [Ramicandelaber brevisporus]
MDSDSHMRRANKTVGAEHSVEKQQTGVQHIGLEASKEPRHESRLSLKRKRAAASLGTDDAGCVVHSPRHQHMALRSALKKRRTLQLEAHGSLGSSHESPSSRIVKCTTSDMYKDDSSSPDVPSSPIVHRSRSTHPAGRRVSFAPKTRVRLFLEGEPARSTVAIPADQRGETSFVFTAPQCDAELDSADQQRASECDGRLIRLDGGGAVTKH